MYIDISLYPIIFMTWHPYIPFHHFREIIFLTMKYCNTAILYRWKLAYIIPDSSDGSDSPVEGLQVPPVHS